MRKSELTKPAKCLITAGEATCLCMIAALLYISSLQFDFFVLLLITLVVIFVFSHQGILSAALDNGFCAFCGRFSLSLYLCHNWIGKSLKNVYDLFAAQGKFGFGADPGEDRILLLILYFGCALAVSAAVYILSVFLRKHSPQIFGFFKKLFLKPSAPAQA